MAEDQKRLRTMDPNLRAIAQHLAFRYSIGIDALHVAIYLDDIDPESVRDIAYILREDHQVAPSWIEALLEAHDTLWDAKREIEAL